MSAVFISIAVTLITYWLFKPWESIYMVENEIIDVKTYGEINIFRAPFRKIYRNRVYSELEYDIFCLKSCNRLTKINKYILATLDDEPEILKQIKGN